MNAPERLTDAEFWTLTEDLSEPNGFFKYDNLLSNERGYQRVIPGLIRRVQPGGVYLGAEGGLNWMFNNSFTSTLTFPGFGSGSTTTNMATNMGWVAGGVVGYDFLGPRVELEGVYRENTGTLSVKIGRAHV